LRLTVEEKSTAKLIKKPKSIPRRKCQLALC
jgi:hypothetical protein